MANKHGAITIDIDTSGIDAAVEHLSRIKGSTPEAIKKSLNVAVVGMKSDAGREVSKAFVIDAATVKQRMRVTKAKVNSLSAEVERRGRPFTATRFPFDPNTMPGIRGGRAVFVRYRRDGGGELLDAERHLSKAFAVGGAGGRVFRRTSPQRMPIDFARVISAPEMLSDAEVRRAIEAGAVRRLNEELDRQIHQLLSRGEGDST